MSEFSQSDERPAVEPEPKRPYHSPELRPLGPMADLVQATQTPGTTSDATYGTSAS